MTFNITRKLADKISFGYLQTDITPKRDKSRVVRIPVFCICENKDEDRLRGNREADQRLCFRYTDSKIPPLP